MNGFFLTADVIGFSNIVKNSNSVELNDRIGGWIAVVEAAARNAEVTRIQLISDTVFAVSDSTPEGLLSLIRFSQHVLQEGLAASLPVRGAITHGHFEWGQLTYGKAVIQSHQLESTQDWVGIACESNLLFVEQMWGLDKLVCYPAPLKSGPIKLCPVVAWNVPEFAKITKLLTSNGLSAEGEQLSWQFAHKVRNTVEFGLYLKMIAKSGNDPCKFHGLLPIQIIELSINK